MVEREALSFKKIPRLIRTSENLGASVLEQTLGILFDVRPTEIRFTLRNALVLTLSPFCRDMLREFSATQRYHTESKSLGANFAFTGFYLRPWNAIFLNKGVSSTGEHALHENLHSYIFQTNHGLVEFCDKLKDTISQDESSLDLSTTNKALSYLTMMEGMTTWGASEAVGRIGQNRRLGDPRGIEMIARRIDLHQGQYQHDYTYWLNVLNVSSEAELDLYADTSFAEASIMVPHQAGPEFIRIIMDYLMIQGLKPAEAINLIIQNPPEKIDSLYDPLKFGDNLLRLKQ